MSREKQIEEMARDICVECPFTKCIPCKICHSWIYAEEAFNKGYRKFTEVEKLEKKVEELSEILSDTIRIRYAEAKREIAEEIFEEIWENADLLYDGYRDIVVITEKDFAELKKKYTEGGENGTDGISS